MGEHAVLGRHQLVGGVERPRELVEMFQDIVQVPAREVLGYGGFAGKDVREDLQRLAEVKQALDGHLHEEGRVVFHTIAHLLSRFLQHDLWQLLIQFLEVDQV